MQIELRQITKSFGAIRANDAIDASFRGGRIYGVLGENGAGKSTLMKILSGYQRADRGSIAIDGQSRSYHTPQAAIAAGIGMLQQDPLDIPAFTVLENFVYGQPGGPGLGKRRAMQQLQHWCKRLGFALDPEQNVAQLSIGQRQQLEVVRLLALGVRALILDEPTTGISAAQKEALFEALRELARRDAMIILLVSHKLEDVLALCDEVLVLRGGRRVGEVAMPATTAQLVTLMFGQALPAVSRQPAAHGDEVIRLEQVSLRDRRVTVDHYSLAVHAGEVVGFAGLDGSGQELVLRALGGLAKVQRGRVLVRGQDFTRRPYRSYIAQGIAYAAAGRLEEGLIAGLSLTDHVALTQSGMWVNWTRARQETERRIRLYNVRGQANSRIEALSGGNQQRMLMALLPQQPALLALEQPTRGLDIDSAQWIWKQLLARRQSGTAIVFTSPDLDELVLYSDRIVVFFAGRAAEIPDASRTDIDELGRLIGGHAPAEAHAL